MGRKQRAQDEYEAYMRLANDPSAQHSVRGQARARATRIRKKYPHVVNTARGRRQEVRPRRREPTLEERLVGAIGRATVKAERTRREMKEAKRAAQLERERKEKKERKQRARDERDARRAHAVRGYTGKSADRMMNDQRRGGKSNPGDQVGFGDF